MIDITLRTPDRATLRTALLSCGLWDAVSDTPITASHQHSLDVAGTQYAQDGTVTDAKTGITTPSMQPIKGYWAYLRITDESRTDWAKALAPITVDPLATTLRTWSGSAGPDTSRKFDPKSEKFVAVAKDAVVAKSAVETVSGKVLAAAVAEVMNGELAMDPEVEK